ncbi:hypothetical protein B0T24DRAFT_596320 [Lasiosphaeria ovina]|uniref:Uncharacterized protein n=1 Tax=Lasiosphaeria ovina TaxID=92902 RepID=A0AAE0N3P5_9PEZI|nr:hypothetical protein B0T24DRAFT_596320 [Lasiosphaeria ovina]
MKFLAILAIATHLAAPALADFFIYQGLESYIDVGAFNTYSFFRGPPDCNDVNNAPRYDESDDVSGDKQGVACDGRGCWQANPDDIDRLEFNTRFGHFTMYKDRGRDIFDIWGGNVGHCDPDTSHHYECPSGPYPSPLSGKRVFFCRASFGP